ncbi:MAG TPA: primosomal protein N' [Kofleriaceae bacterium]
MTEAAREHFVEVAVMLPVTGRYHYRVPAGIASKVHVGSRALVRFGNRKVTGVVVQTDVTPPPGIEVVTISDLLDDKLALPVDLVELCMWVADYYEAPPGEVLRAALPAGTSVGARAVITLTDAGRVAAGELGSAMPAKQRAVLARLTSGDLPASGLSAANRRIVEALATQNLVETREHRDTARTRLRRERTVRLAVPIEVAREAVSRAPKRWAVVDSLANGEVISATQLEDKVPGAKALLRDLEKSGLVELADREVAITAVVTGADMLVIPPPILTDEQAFAVTTITNALAAGRLAPGASTAAHAVVGTASAEMTAAESASATSSPSTIPSESSSGAPFTSAETNATAENATAQNPTAVNATTASESANATSEASSAGRTPFMAFLLHGVTGSGKTEVYLRVIAEALEAGRTALVLVPEISLTPQLAARFRARFGDLVAILHSGMSEQARMGEWSRLQRGEATIAVGARSAVFAPVANLGVIVVDEEHDGSFKQDEGVKYHARDVALVRAQRAGAVCVLGSATPSLETMAHAERGQYRRLVLTQRPTARPMPVVEVIDLKTYMPDGEAMLSAPLRNAIRDTLAAGDQTILFLNRRGFATFVLCRACGHSFRCLHCSVSLTYHRRNDRLSCHYCGHTERVPDACPKCKAVETIERKGLGTEKVADAVATEFPEARVARLDRDVASGSKIEAVLSRVARREIDVLVGTQMVTKGHDFPGVTLVGVLCADTGLNLPDFRASERTFQLLAQVAGRAGRGDKPGKVLIQTYSPDAAAVVAAAAHDYERFFVAESAARAELGYPPHGRLIAVRIDGKDEHDVAGVAQRLAQVAEAIANRTDPPAAVEVRGPVAAPLEKLRGRTRWQVWLRSADRHALRRVARGLLAVEVPSSVRVGLDVDPVSAM